MGEGLFPNRAECAMFLASTTKKAKPSTSCRMVWRVCATRSALRRLHVEALRATTQLCDYDKRWGRDRALYASGSEQKETP